MLDVSRIESGKTEPQEQEFELEDMVESVTAMLRTVLGKRRQQLSVEIEDGIHMSVVGDQQRIRQILVNLLDNASKYTKEGGSIRLSLEELRRRIRGMWGLTSLRWKIMVLEYVRKILHVSSNLSAESPTAGSARSLEQDLTYDRQNLVQMMNGEIRG